MVLDIEKLKSKKSTKELLNFGIINIDKPSGPTSFNISSYVKKALNINKTSHLGTLDPSVSGVLPIALSRACRLNEYLMHKNKVYVGIMRLHSDVSKKELKEAIDNHIGKIKQMPPLRSSVKRAIREREVFYFKILEVQGKDVLFQTEVQAGTYIRTLCVDIGNNIGGAHMLELRRISAGFFNESKSINLYEFDDIIKSYKNGDDSKLREVIVPGEIVTNFLPIVKIKKQVLKKVLSGSPIFPSFLEDEKEIKELKKEEKICIFCEEKFIGCYNFIGNQNISAKPEFIFN